MCCDPILYDVIEGNLGALRTTGGDFSLATVGCLTTTPLTTHPFTAAPGAGLGFWFLIRKVTASGNGTYHADAVSHVGLRDAEIAASGFDCP